MPLTPEEQQEMLALQKQLGTQSKPSGLTPDEQKEMEMLQKQLQPHGMLDQAKEGMNRMLSGTASERDPWIKQAALSSGTGGLQQLAGEGLATVVKGIGSGLGNAGDFLMQKAAGIKKYIPGVGQTLADEGVMGTKGMMSGQIDRALESRGQEIGDLAKSVPSVSTRTVAERLGEKAANFMDSEGNVIPENQTAYRKYLEASTTASNEGSVSGEVAATRRSQYGKIARDAGRYRDNPAQGLKSQLAGDQQAGYSQALKSLSPDLAQADKAYGNLSTASQAINQPQSITPMGIMGKSLPTLIGGGLGGLPGAATGAALSTPLAQSVLGRGLIGMGKGVNAVSPGMKLFPATLTELLKRNQDDK